MSKAIKRFFITGIFILLVLNINKSVLASEYKNITKVYFLSEVTAGYGNGDCILLENYDSKGEVHYGLIDTGNKVNTVDDNGNASTKVNDFLKAHMKTNELEFVIITHSHGDHNGDAETVINNFNVKTLYMKEYDNLYSNSNGWQWKYEEVIKAAMNNNTFIIGCNYKTLNLKEINPSTSKPFLDFLNQNSNKEYLFKEFDGKNTKFNFGSSIIEILNWEFLNKDGSIWNYGDDIRNREIVTNENNNSLGILLKQGNKKAFFAGDINNNDKDESINKTGDEDRIKDIIGDIDLLKLGHHGYSGSNTEEYLNTLKPEYAVITNDTSRAYIDTINWLKENNTEYLYNTTDKKAVIATITNNSVNLNFETSGEIKKINQNLYYISKNTNEETDWKKLIYKIEYNEIKKNISTWEELDEVIKANKNNYSVDDKYKKIIITKLTALINNNLIANKNIEIDKNQFITILPKNNNDISITRDLAFKKEFFTIKGILTLGKENLQSKIILDGNKENVLSESSIIEVDNGTLNIYDNVFIRNNNHIITKDNNMISNNDGTITYSASGSGILLKNESIFNMYGGEISGNIVENKKELNLENIDINNNYSASCDGAGLYITRQSILNMYGGKITNNALYNNSIITLNNAKDNAFSYGIYQINIGSGICCNYSKINIESGEISNNYSENNSILKMINSQIKSTDNSIYGVGIYNKGSIININNGIFQENNGINNANINVQNSNISNNLNSIVNGGAIGTEHRNVIIEKSYFEKNKIDVNSKINLNNSYVKRITTTPHGAAILNLSSEITLNDTTIKENECYNNSDITLENKSRLDEIFSSSRGGMVYGYNSKLNIKNNLLSYGVAKSNVKIVQSEDSSITQKNDLYNSYGGAIDVYNSTLNITDSKLNYNSASFGGAIFTDSNNCITKITSTEICNNIATNGSGGGIFTFGKLFISEKNTKINENIAKTYGGGLIIKNIAIIEDAEICNNKAENNAGGGIRADGRLIIISGKVSNNTSKTTGGGIDYTSGILINKNSIIFNNTSNDTEMNNIYPQISKITKDEIPPEVKIGYKKKEGQEVVEVTIEVKDLLSEVRQVTINGKEFEASNDGTIKVNIGRNGIYILKARDYIGNVATKEFVISNLIENNTNQQNNENKITDENKDSQNNTINTNKEKEESQKGTTGEIKNNIYIQNNIVEHIKTINNTKNIKENSVQETGQVIEDRTIENTTSDNTEEKNINKHETNEDITNNTTSSTENTNLVNQTINNENNINNNSQNMITSEKERNQYEVEYSDSDYIDDNDEIFKEIQEALASNVPRTGQRSLTLIFIVLGLISIASYIKYRRYREIL